MPKMIMFCADGTWNNPYEDENQDHAPDPTNVYKLFTGLDGALSPDSLLLAGHGASVHALNKIARTKVRAKVQIMSSTTAVNRSSVSLGIFASALIGANVLAGPITPVPDKVPGAITDRQDFQTPDRVQLTGWLGSRIAVIATNRLEKRDPGRLLEGYR